MNEAVDSRFPLRADKTSLLHFTAATRGRTGIMASDILFTSATVISGDEAAVPRVADVLVSGGVVARIGAPGSIDAEAGPARRVDATGHVLSPGFIDMHAHSDLYLLTHPEHEAKITQGCTVCLPLGPHQPVTWTAREKD